MENEKITIRRFDDKNVNDYKAVLDTNYIPREFDTLSIQKLENGKNVFLMFREYAMKFLFFKNQKTELIGYAIVEDVNALPKDYKGYWHIIYGVHENVLKKNPIVISDFMISRINRRKGYGRKLAEHIINDVYCNKRISLQSVEDGVHFWYKFGFEYVNGNSSAMIIKDSKRNP
ncbi:MAG: GNAT family N-acetyltransferase [Ruminococcus sp.]|nr:GNAT family N-acetyltransferase [Ruminococcus sp.]